MVTNRSTLSVDDTSDLTPADVVTRVVNVRHHLVEIAEALPPIPTSVVQLATAVSNEDTSIDDIASIVGRDPALTTMLLSEANSAASAPANEIVTVRAAITRLGLARVLAVSCAGTIGAQAHGPLPAYQLPAGALWDHAITASYIADVIYRNMKGEIGPDVVTSALLHDIGQIILDKVLDPALFATVASRSSIEAAERELLAISHAETGALLLEIWGIPATISETVRNHHQPHYTHDDPATVVCLASNVAHEIHPHPTDYEPPRDASSHELAGALGVDYSTIVENSVTLLQAAGRLHKEVHRRDE